MWFSSVARFRMVICRNENLIKHAAEVALNNLTVRGRMSEWAGGEDGRRRASAGRGEGRKVMRRRSSSLLRSRHPSTFPSDLFRLFPRFISCVLLSPTIFCSCLMFLPTLPFSFPSFLSLPAILHSSVPYLISLHPPSPVFSLSSLLLFN